MSDDIKYIDPQFYEDLFSTSQKMYALEKLNHNNSQLSFENIMDTINNILEKRTEIGLSPQEVTRILFFVLDSNLDPESQTSLSNMINVKASELRKNLFLDKVSVMAPIEISSYCASNCSFCGWGSSNKKVSRFQISKLALLEQADKLINEGFSHLELAGGDDLGFIRTHLLEFVEALKKLSERKNKPIKISICFSPFPESFYKSLHNAGATTSFVWQESYDPITYQKYIKSGPKAYGVNENLNLDLNMNGYLNRLTSQERAIRSGLQVGLGTMLGLSPHLGPEILSVVAHGKKLIDHYGPSISPLIIGMPTWNKITTDYEDGISDKSIEDIFTLVAAIYLLAFPDDLAWPFANCRVPMGVQAKTVATASPFTSTAVRVGPGGYINTNKNIALENYFIKSNLKTKDINKIQILNGEQFRHYYSSHNSYLENFKKFGIDRVVSESEL